MKEEEPIKKTDKRGIDKILMVLFVFLTAWAGILVARESGNVAYYLAPVGSIFICGFLWFVRFLSENGYLFSAHPFGWIPEVRTFAYYFMLVMLNYFVIFIIHAILTGKPL